MRAYADLIRSDFESYIADVQDYFRCLDTERARAFTEAREVSDDYGRLLNSVEYRCAAISLMPSSITALCLTSCVLFRK